MSLLKTWHIFRTSGPTELGVLEETTSDNHCAPQSVLVAQLMMYLYHLFCNILNRSFLTLELREMGGFSPRNGVV